MDTANDLKMRSLDDLQKNLLIEEILDKRKPKKPQKIGNLATVVSSIAAFAAAATALSIAQKDEARQVVPFGSDPHVIRARVIGVGSING